MSRHRIFEIVVIIALLSLGTFVVTGFTAEKETCTDEQINYCVKQVKKNLAECKGQGCYELFDWFENTCMIEASQCNPEKVVTVMMEMGLPLY